MKGIGGMDSSEIEAKTEQALELLDEVAAAIKLMRKEEFERYDLTLAAWNLIGGARVSIRSGLYYFRQAIKDERGRE